jgi:hypothetical protein
MIWFFSSLILALVGGAGLGFLGRFTLVRLRPKTWFDRIIIALLCEFFDVKIFVGWKTDRWVASVTTFGGGRSVGYSDSRACFAAWDALESVRRSSPEDFR